MSEYVSKKLRAAIAHRAGGRCEYCCSPAAFCIDPFVAEHIHPVARGGLTVADNLAYACMGCNGYKQDKTEATQSVRLSLSCIIRVPIHGANISRGMKSLRILFP